MIEVTNKIYIYFSNQNLNKLTCFVHVDHQSINTLTTVNFDFDCAASQME